MAFFKGQALIAAFPENKHMIRWLEQAQKKVAFQGLPARICWLGLGERETECMKDGSDAVSDWPLLNLMSNTAGGATRVLFHHGGVGMGYSQHAGMVVLADVTERAARCLKRVLHIDPALGVIRHADAGYEEAKRDFRRNLDWESREFHLPRAF